MKSSPSGFLKNLDSSPLTINLEDQKHSSHAAEGDGEIHVAEKRIENHDVPVGEDGDSGFGACLDSTLQKQIEQIVHEYCREHFQELARQVIREELKALAHES